MRTIIYSFLLLWGLHPALAQTGSQNYILSRNYKQTGAGADDVSKVDIQVHYFDGLGRPSQTVSVGQSTSGSDLVVPNEYDAYGREPKQYLPYAAQSNGDFQSAAISTQAGFYSGNSAQLDPSDLGRPYTENFFENSPLNRPRGFRAPGDHSASSTIVYRANTEGEVTLYDYTANPSLTATITQNDSYEAGKLYLTQITDENGKVSREYRDFQERVVCKKILDGSESLDTYYVYDDYGQLRAVLQPRYQDEAELSEYAFLYRYDDRGRVTEKHVPGAGITQLVYDNFDRPVLSQDANQQARGVWGFTKYDSFNRGVMTGEVTSAQNRATWQGQFNASTAHHETPSGSGIGYSLTSTLPAVSESDVYTVTYYNYGFPRPASLDYDGSGSPNLGIRTLPTGNRTRILGGSWLTSVFYYDAEKRVIQTVRELHDLAGAIERVTLQYQYDLAPVVAEEKTEHVLGGTVANALVKTFEYDHADRLLSVKEKASNGTYQKEAVTLAQRYTILGQLKSKWFHAYEEEITRFRRRTDYTHNIRGWMTAGQTNYLYQASLPESPFYGFELAYANGSNYTNGNISSMRWKGKDATSYTTGLSFSYDGANRLTGSTGLASYAETESGITYDKNGNIKTLNRAGFAVDNLTYQYIGAGNQLTSIVNTGANGNGVKNGASDYSYDANGNLLIDGNRGATLTYNYLNLPQTVTINSKTFTYDYDASGTKHKYYGDTVNIKYAGAFEYDGSDALKRVATAGGQAVPGGDTLAFQYYLKDHLGNVRVVFDENGKIVQETDYYPFGLSIPRSGTDAVNRYQFLNREKQPETGYIDLQARFYDPGIGRFFNVDPETEGQLEFSPYHYSFNNPIRFSDPDGRFPGCCGQVVDFLSGVGSALNDNMFAGTPFNAAPGYVDAYNTGRTAGHYLSMAVGAAEIVTGTVGGIGAVVGEVGSVGLATPVAVPVAAVSTAMVVHGAATGAKAIDNLRNDKGRVNASSSESSGTNGNSKSSTKAQHNYDVKDTQTGNTVKTGVSGGKETKAGVSYQGNSQANKWNKQEGAPGRYKSETTNHVPAGPGARQKALDYESQRANNLRNEGQLRDPNKHNRP